MRTLILSVSFSLVAVIVEAQNNDKIGFGTNTPQSRVEIRGSDTLSSSSALNVTDSAHNSILFVRNDHHVGIGTSSPIRTFSVGSSNQLQVDSVGNLRKVNNIPYSWPSSQGASNTILSNDGNGNLSWVPSGGTVSSVGVADSTGAFTIGSSPITTSGTINIQTKPVQTLTDGATIAWNVQSGNIATVTLGGNRTLSITHAVSGGIYTIIVKQDSTGSRTLTLPSGSKVVGGGSGAVILSTASSSVDILTALYDGTNFYWTYGTGYN